MWRVSGFVMRFLKLVAVLVIRALLVFVGSDDAIVA
jgi:hypothetical protein